VLKVHDPATFTDTIERVNVNDITVEQFMERYEKGSRPCILTGVTDSWRGMEEWQLKVSSKQFYTVDFNTHFLTQFIFVQRLVERFGSSLFKIGESDSGRKLKVTLKEYIEYALFNRDDSPLYLFESNIEEHPTMKEIVDEYEPPKPLRQDYFVELVSKSQLLTSALKNLTNKLVLLIVGREESASS
jgi:histone arginine demethylase JMJD6